MAPFGFILDGLEDEVEVDKDGTVWSTSMNNWNVDEYGDRSFMWDYR